MSRVHVQLLALVIMLAVVAGAVLDKPASPESGGEDNELGLIRGLRSLSDTDVKRLQRRGWLGGGSSGSNSFSLGGSTTKGGSLNGAYKYTNGPSSFNLGGSTANGGSLNGAYKYTNGPSSFNLGGSTTNGGSLNAGYEYNKGPHSFGVSGSTANGGSANLGYKLRFKK